MTFPEKNVIGYPSGGRWRFSRWCIYIQKFLEIYLLQYSIPLKRSMKSEVGFIIKLKNFYINLREI
jgi:hypothetical protein